MSVEIERKWLLNDFPNEADVQHISTHQVSQAYLNADPEVRIRMKLPANPITNMFTLAIKGKGSLSRIEVEYDISKGDFASLLQVCGRNVITKDYRKYKLPTGEILEVSKVDGEWFYCEVEFNSENEALAFQAPDWFGTEVTHDANYKMVNYWKASRLVVETPSRIAVGMPCKVAKLILRDNVTATLPVPVLASLMKKFEIIEVIHNFTERQTEYLAYCEEFQAVTAGKIPTFEMQILRKSFFGISQHSFELNLIPVLE